MENKERSPEMNAIISELENEYSIIAKDRTSSILLSNKLNNFYTLINEKILAKCPNEIKNAEMFNKVKEVQKGDYQFVPLPGKEKEAKESVDTLNTCMIQYSAIIQQLQYHLQYNMAILSGTSESCINDCENNIKSAITTEMKECVRNCYKFDFNYTYKTIESLLNEELDFTIENLKKL